MPSSIGKRRSLATMNECMSSLQDHTSELEAQNIPVVLKPFDSDDLSK